MLYDYDIGLKAVPKNIYWNRICMALLNPSTQVNDQTTTDPIEARFVDLDTCYFC